MPVEQLAGRRYVPAALALGGVLLAGCSGQPETVSTPSPAPTVTASYGCGFSPEHPEPAGAGAATVRVDTRCLPAGSPLLSMYQRASGQSAKVGFLGPNGQMVRVLCETTGPNEHDIRGSQAASDIWLRIRTSGHYALTGYASNVALGFAHGFAEC